MATETWNADRRMPAWLKVALVLAIIGALNWGLIGLFNWNLVDAIFGGGAREMTSAASRVLYALVGLAGLGSLAVFSRARESHHHRIETAPLSR